MCSSCPLIIAICGLKTFPSTSGSSWRSHLQSTGTCRKNHLKPTRKLSMTMKRWCHPSGQGNRQNGNRVLVSSFETTEEGVTLWKIIYASVSFLINSHLLWEGRK